MGNSTKYSNWLIYSGLKNAPVKTRIYKDYRKNKNRKLNRYEEGRITDLRAWADNFFFKNSLKFVLWWTDLNIKD